MNGDFGNVDVKIDAIEDGSGDLFLVTLDLAGKTFAGSFFGAKKAAGTRIGGSDENELGRIAHGTRGSGDLDDAIFHGLTKAFENVTGKFREFVEEKDTSMGERDFSRHGFGAAANKTNTGSGVVRVAKGAGGDDGVSWGNVAGDGVDFGNFNGFGLGKIGKNTGKSASHHGFTGSRSTEKKYIMSPTGGDFQSPFSLFLATDFGEVKVSGGGFLEVAEVGLGMRGNGSNAREMSDKVFETGDGIDVEAGNDASFLGVGGGKIEMVKSLFFSKKSEGKGTFGMAERAIERKFAEKKGMVELSGDLTGSEEKADSDREIVGWTFFGKIGRCEVDGDTTRREIGRGVFKSGANTFFGFIDGFTGKTNNGDRRKALGSNVDFDFNED